MLHGDVWSNHNQKPLVPVVDPTEPLFYGGLARIYYTGKLASYLVDKHKASTWRKQGQNNHSRWDGFSGEMFGPDAASCHSSGLVADDLGWYKTKVGSIT